MAQNKTNGEEVVEPKVGEENTVTETAPAPTIEQCDVSALYPHYSFTKNSLVNIKLRSFFSIFCFPLDNLKK